MIICCSLKYRLYIKRKPLDSQGSFNRRVCVVYSRADGIIMVCATYLLTSLVGLILTLLYLLKKRYQHWTNKGIYQIEPTWLVGNLQDVVRGKTSLGNVVTNWYNEFKQKGLPYGGAYLFLKPTLVVLSPDLLKKIMTTDFVHFNSHGSFGSEETDPLTAHLFNLEGHKWKVLRAKLTPTFTSGKMKMMFNTIQGCTSGLKEMLGEYSTSGQPVDIKDILGRFTTDVIGNCAFGLDCNSIKDPNNEFRYYGKKALDTNILESIKIIAFITFPKSVREFFRMKASKPDVEKFFFKVVEDTVNYREENNVIRKDFMHLLLQLKNKGKVTDDDDFKSEDDNVGESLLNMNEVTAQAFLFFIAGFETSSTTMTYTLYELATNQDVQEKLRKEINEVLEKYNQEVTYDAIKEMKYLDQVINETLRKHPPVVSIPRTCTKDYNIPGTDIIIEKGTAIQVPAQGLHMDPDHFENPEKFDPERFSDENKSKIKPYTYLPFGEGPRICIGLRFGVLQSKIGLISILRNYKITLNDKTKLPIEMDPHSLIIKAIKGGLWVNVIKS